MTLEQAFWIGVDGFAIVLPLMLLELIYAGTMFLQFPFMLFWGVTVVDQMPCFLGVPNCD